MTEFEINMSEMPLGKLSKENIQKGVLISFLMDLIFSLQMYDDVKMVTLALLAGFEALTEIQNLLKNTADQALAVRESLIVAASNRFFTLIPSIHPHIIQDEDEIMIKVCSHYPLLFL
jgi:poly [ADP-ribose] polymerase